MAQIRAGREEGQLPAGTGPAAVAPWPGSPELGEKALWCTKLESEGMGRKKRS